MRRHFFAGTGAIMLAALWACGQDPIEWGPPAPLPANISAAPQLALDTGQSLVSRASESGKVPASEGQCPASVRVARSSADWYAAWWRLRPDGTADLVVSHSVDGATWAIPIRVDTIDVGRVGCERPPPSIAANGADVHVAYAMTAREGPGIFASHSMDRGMLFHSPVAVVYGERLGRTAVAARGNRVAVAFEDPNTNPQRIGLAFSRSQGHSFESREVVSPPTGEARGPSVTLGASKIAVIWTRGIGVDSTREFRVGTIR